MYNDLLKKLFRMVATMVCASLGTAFVLLGAVPDVSRPGVVFGASVVALIVGMYDFGLFREELEV